VEAINARNEAGVKLMIGLHLVCRGVLIPNFCE